MNIGINKDFVRPPEVTERVHLDVAELRQVRLRAGLLPHLLLGFANGFVHRCIFLCDFDDPSTFVERLKAGNAAGELLQDRRLHRGAAWPEDRRSRRKSLCHGGDYPFVSRIKKRNQEGHGLTRFLFPQPDRPPRRSARYLCSPEPQASRCRGVPSPIFQTSIPSLNPPEALVSDCLHPAVTVVTCVAIITRATTIHTGYRLRDREQLGCSPALLSIRCPRRLRKLRSPLPRFSGMRMPLFVRRARSPTGLGQPFAPISRGSARHSHPLQQVRRPGQNTDLFFPSGVHMGSLSPRTRTRRMAASLVRPDQPRTNVVRILRHKG